MSVNNREWGLGKIGIGCEISQRVYLFGSAYLRWFIHNMTLWCTTVAPMLTSDYGGGGNSFNSIYRHIKDKAIDQGNSQLRYTLKTPTYLRHLRKRFPNTLWSIIEYRCCDFIHPSLTFSGCNLLLTSPQ